MELVLAHQAGTQISASCDGQFSHTFDLKPLLLRAEEEFLKNPIGYGRKLYEALFPQNTPAQRILAARAERLLLVALDNDIDSVPWEYAYGPDGFLVLECHFVRGLPADQRIDPPMLDSGPHIIAVPSNPLSHAVAPLNIDSEWMRLKEIIQELPYAISLERTQPPTLERLRQLVANQKGRVIHFMGHGGQDETGAVLCFEQDNGDLDEVTAKQFVQRIHGTVFLVTLNACVSATPGSTSFSNLAATLIRQKVPYALGMRFSIHDDDARTFSHTFYRDLARGTSVEEALHQARLTLAKSSRPWVLGVSVLYTSLAQPASGFASLASTPLINEYRPKVEISALPRAEGTFQGRINELKALGTALTGDSRPQLLTIHGSSGQGKTALAREAVERFAYAWPGGVWAISLENLPSREVFVNNLARFLGIAPQEVTDPSEMERRVLARLGQRRTLIVLDNAETLVEGVEADNVAARRLAQFIREQLPRPPVSLLVTSRSYLRWSSEIGCELEGLAPMEGIRLFLQSAPQRMEEINPALAWELSQKVDGHPLSLHLLSSAFNAGATPFSAFVEEYEAHLLSAENKYKAVDHRHRTLYASIETSIRYLDAELRALLSGLWLFHAPFLPETAAVIFDRETENSEVDHPLIYAQLNMLWQRGLLSREMAPINDQSVLFYRLQSTVRSYIERYLEQYYAREILLTRFKAEYRRLVDFLTRELDQSAVAVYIAQQTREDLEWGRESVASTEQASYLLDLGGVIQQLGDTRRALELFERVLEYVQGQDSGMEARALGHIAVIYQSTGQPRQALALHEQVLSVTRKMGDSALEAAALNNMGLVYLAMGQPQQALTLLEQALAIVRKMNNRESEAKTVNGIAEVYRATGQPQRALALYEQALFIMRELANRRGEAVTLNNMGLAYHAIGQPQRALELYEQALPIRREMSDWAGEADTLNNMGLAWRDMDQAERALLLFEQALPIRVQVGDRRGESTTLSNIGLIYSDMSQSERALQLYEQALSLSHEVDDRPGETTILSNMATVYRKTGQPERAIERYEQALSVAYAVGNHTEEATTLCNMAEIYQDAEQPERAMELYKQALPIMREAGNWADKPFTLSNMAFAYQKAGQLEQALELYEQALPALHKRGDRVQEATVLNKMGLAYKEIKRVKEALTLYEQALQMQREAGDRAGEAQTLYNKALAHKAAGQSEQALSLLEEALAILRELGDRTGEAAILTNIAGVYQGTEQLQQALEIFEQALPIVREVNNRSGEADTLHNMALIYLATERPLQALVLLEQTLSIQREVSNREGEAKAFSSTADVYQAMGKPQQALAHYEQALAIVREVGDRIGEVTVLTDMAGVYQTLGQLQQILGVFQQTLLVYRELQDRMREVATLNRMAELYRTMGQPQEALRLWEEALLIQREVGNREGEVATLNNMAMICQIIGQPQRALKLWEQALPILHEKGDRAGEVATLSNMATAFDTIGKPQQALKLYGQALPVLREMGNQTGEATTLSNMALVYHGIGQSQQALALLEEALPIQQEVGSREGEAITLNNMALVYQAIGQQERALELAERALSIHREVGDRVAECASLNNMALVYQAIGQPQQALDLWEQALPLVREVGDRANEVTMLSNMAGVLYLHLDSPQIAIQRLEQAIAIMAETGLPQGAAGETVGFLHQLLASMRANAPNSSIRNITRLPTSQIEQIINNTVVAMTVAQKRRAEWHDALTKALQQAKSINRPQEAELFTAILALLDGQIPTLPEGHLYAEVLTAIKDGITASGSHPTLSEIIEAVRVFLNADDWNVICQVVEEQQELLFRPEVEILFEQNIAHARTTGNQQIVELLESYLTLLHACKAQGIAKTFKQTTMAQEDVLTFDTELIPRSIAALLGNPQEKLAHMEYLANLGAQTTDEMLKVFIGVIQLALFDGDLSQLGQNLSGVYQRAWKTIVVSVETRSTKQQM